MLDYFHFKREKACENKVNEIIKKIKSGDKGLKENFIRDYKPFVLKTVSQITGKYINADDSEEFSIGLLAFNEAIDNFDESMNSNFLSYSKQNIKWKLTNYYNKTSKNKNVYPFTYFENETTGEFENKYLKVDSSQVLDTIETKEQFSNLEKRLKEFDISFEDLIVDGPKHKDSKKLLLNIAREIKSHDELFNKMVKYKSIPITDLMRYVKVSRRTIERNRKFIIAASLILNEDFDFLRDY